MLALRLRAVGADVNVRTPDGLVHLVLYREDAGSYGETACLRDFANDHWERRADPPEHVVWATKVPDGEVLTCLTCAVKPHTVDSRAHYNKPSIGKPYEA